MVTLTKETSVSLLLSALSLLAGFTLGSKVFEHFFSLDHELKGGQTLLQKLKKDLISALAFAPPPPTVHQVMKRKMCLTIRNNQF